MIAQMQSGIDFALQNAFDGNLTAVHITTVAQKNRDRICRPQVRRRMLATTADLIFTVVLEVQVIRDKYFFDEVALAKNMITSVMGLTNTTYFKLCGGSTSDEACARAIAVEQGVMRDIVLHFSLHNPNPEFPFDHMKFANIVQRVYGPGTTAVMSTPIHVSGESTEFHVTISVPFLNVYYDDNITAVMNNLPRGRLYVARYGAARHCARHARQCRDFHRKEQNDSDYCYAVWRKCSKGANFRAAFRLFDARHHYIYDSCPNTAGVRRDFCV